MDADCFQSLATDISQNNLIEDEDIFGEDILLLSYRMISALRKNSKIDPNIFEMVSSHKEFDHISQWISQEAHSSMLSLNVKGPRFVTHIDRRFNLIMDYAKFKIAAEYLEENPSGIENIPVFFRRFGKEFPLIS